MGPGVLTVASLSTRWRSPGEGGDLLRPDSLGLSWLWTSHLPFLLFVADALLWVGREVEHQPITWFTRGPKAEVLV